MRRRLPVVLMVLGFLALVWAGVRVLTEDDGDSAAEQAAATKCIFPACRANANPVPARGYENASVVVDPADPDHIVVIANNLVEAKCSWHVTFNRGREWEDHAFQLPAGFQPCGLESSGLLSSGELVRGPSGTLYATLSSRPSAVADHDSVLLATSTDGGRTFSPARVVMELPDPQTALVRSQLSSVPGPSGRDEVLITATACKPDPNQGNQRACVESWFGRSTDGGQTFSSPVLVSEPPGGTTPSKAVVLDDGTITVTYVRRGFADGGAQLLLARSTDSGVTFRSTVVDVQPALGQTRDPAKLAASPDGKTLYTVFTDRRTGSPQVYFRRSLDKGGTWEQAIQLVPPGPAAATSLNPALSVAPDGRIDVAFYREGAEKRENVHWMYSVNGGLRFVGRQLNESPIIREDGVGFRNEVGNHYTPDISSLDDGAVFVWSETADPDRVTNVQEILLRKMELATDEP